MSGLWFTVTLEKVRIRTGNLGDDKRPVARKDKFCDNALLLVTVADDTGHDDVVDGVDDWVTVVIRAFTMGFAPIVGEPTGEFASEVDVVTEKPNVLDDTVAAVVARGR